MGVNYLGVVRVHVTIRLVLAAFALAIGLGGLTGLVFSAVAGADPGLFVMCQDGREGVVGDHTTCDFAANVRKAFYLQNMPREFTAYSPYTGVAYDMDCGGIIPVHFVDGKTFNGIRCYGGEGAEVVIW